MHWMVSKGVRASVDEASFVGKATAPYSSSEEGVLVASSARLFQSLNLPLRGVNSQRSVEAVRTTSHEFATQRDTPHPKMRPRPTNASTATPWQWLPYRIKLY